MKGRYPKDYEDPELAGQYCIGVKFVGNADKSQKLSVNNSYVRTTDELKVVVNFDDPDDFGAALWRYVDKLAPGQTRMYCQVASEKFKAQMAREGHGNVWYYPTKPLGANSIKKLFEEGAAILGLPKNFRPHSLRGVGISKMVNAPDVSQAEAMLVARHTSVAASKNYQRTDGISEGNRMRALGVIMPTRPPPQQEELQNLKCPDKKRSADVTDTEKIDHYRSLIKKVKQPTYDDVMMCRGFPEAQTSPVEGDYKYCFSDDEDEKNFKVNLGPQPYSPEEIVLTGRRDKDVSMTQVAIDELKEEMVGVETLVAMRASPLERCKKSENATCFSTAASSILTQYTPPPESKNERQVKLLLDEVRSLKKKVLDRDSDEDLYYDSLENDFQNEMGRLKRGLAESRRRNERLAKENRCMKIEIDRLKNENDRYKRAWQVERKRAHARRSI